MRKSSIFKILKILFRNFSESIDYFDSSRCVFYTDLNKYCLISCLQLCKENHVDTTYLKIMWQTLHLLFLLFPCCYLCSVMAGMFLKFLNPICSSTVPEFDSLLEQGVRYHFSSKT